MPGRQRNGAGTIYSPRKGTGAASARAVVELQRLELQAVHADEAVRQVRELWEILRRKPGCIVHRLYRSTRERLSRLAYSEWQSLPELGGARRELARSPMYRRLHSMLAASSERAYEPFGPVLTIRGLNFTPQTTALLLRFERAPAEPERALALLRDLSGYASHLMMRELGEGEVMVCLAHFDSPDSAAAAAAALGAHEPLRDCRPEVETYTI